MVSIDADLDEWSVTMIKRILLKRRRCVKVASLNSQGNAILGRRFKELIIEIMYVRSNYPKTSNIFLYDFFFLVSLTGSWYIEFLIHLNFSKKMNFSLFSKTWLTKTTFLVKFDLGYWKSIRNKGAGWVWTYQSHFSEKFCKKLKVSFFSEKKLQLKKIFFHKFKTTFYFTLSLSR